MFNIEINRKGRENGKRLEPDVTESRETNSRKQKIVILPQGKI